MMDEHTQACVELQAILAVDAKVHCAAYEEQPMVQLLRHWEARYAAHTVDRALAQVSRKTWRQTALPMALWRFEQKIKRPHAVCCSITHAWPEHAVRHSALLTGAEQLFVARLEYALGEPTRVAAELVEDALRWCSGTHNTDMLFDAIARKPHAWAAFAPVAQQYLHHPNANKRALVLSFGRKATDKMALDPKTPIARAVAADNAFNDALALPNPDLGVVCDVVPLLATLAPQEVGAELGEALRWRYCSDNKGRLRLFDQTIDALVEAGWRRKDAVCLLAPKPNQLGAWNGRFAAHLLPYWTQYMRSTVLDRIEDDLNNVSVKKRAFAEQVVMWQVLAEAGWDRDFFAGCSELNTWRLDMPSVVFERAAVSRNRAKVVAAVAVGADLLAEHAPRGWWAAHRLVEMILGGRALPEGMDVPWPRHQPAVDAPAFGAAVARQAWINEQLRGYDVVREQLVLANVVGQKGHSTARRKM